MDIEEKKEKQRTIQQNKALHVYFQMVSEMLNESGLDMRAVLKPEVEIPWSPKTVKEFMWRPIQRLQLLKKSTTELSTTDIDAVYETMNRHLANHGVHIPFPSIESILDKMRDKDFMR